MKVLGEDATVDELVLIERRWIDACLEGSEASEPRRTRADSSPTVVGLDVARLGGDATVLTVFQSPVVREIVRWRKLDTVQTTDRIEGEYARLGLDRARVPLAVDMDGLGAGVRDQLAARGFRCLEYYGGGAASDPKRFMNNRAESHWRLGRRFEFGDLEIPEHEELIEELLALRWGEDGQGRTRMEDKSLTKSRLGRSPDYSDSLVIAVWAAESTQCSVPVSAVLFAEVIDELSRAPAWRVW